MLLYLAGVNVYQAFDYIHHFTPKPVPPVEAVCAALAKNAVDIHPGVRAFQSIMA